MPFVAFTEDGKAFQTFLVSGNGNGHLEFLPRASNQARAPQAATAIQDALPFVSIAELRRIVGVLSDIIFAAHGHDRLRLFDTLLVLLATKIHDELKNPDNLRLSCWLKENMPGLADRVRQYAQEALAALGCADFAAQLDLGDDALRQVLTLLSAYSLRNTLRLDPQAEVLGTFYQEIVSSTFRGSLGAYFTPKPVADLAAEILGPTPTDTVFDISCGSATFLLSAYRHASRAGAEGGPQLFGCDIQERMVVTSTLNCTLHGASECHFIHHDGLKVDLGKWRQSARAVPKDGFTLIVGNPPFAGFEAQTTRRRKGLEDYRRRGNNPRVHKIIPFVEKVADLLAPEGRAALVVPTSVLNGEAQSFRELRRDLSERAHVEAVVSLPKDAFVHTDCGVEGALLFFKRIDRKSVSKGTTFFWSTGSLGYDRKGRYTKQSDVGKLLAAWKEKGSDGAHWISTKELYAMDRWDVPWLEANQAGNLCFSDKTHVRLTALCRVVRRHVSRREVVPASEYRYFEVGDTDIDTGFIKQIHLGSGAEVLSKGRLRLRVRSGDVLLPNHRDSLIAKSASGIGRSATLVTSELDGCITTDRFTVLEPRIDPCLLIAVLNSRLVRSQFFVHSRGSASFDIRDKVLEDVWVPRELAEESTLAETVISLFRKRDALVAELNDTRKTIESVIDEGFRGTIRRAATTPP